MTRWARRRAMPCSVLVFVATLASCGLGEQHEPVPIPVDAVPFELSVPSTGAPTTTTTVAGLEPPAVQVAPNPDS